MSASHYRSSKSLELSVLFSAQPDSNEQKIAVAIPPPKFNFFLLFQASSVLLPFGFKANGNEGGGGGGGRELRCYNVALRYPPECVPDQEPAGWSFPLR